MTVCKEHSGLVTEINHLKEDVRKIPNLEEAVLKLTMLVEAITSEKNVTLSKKSFWDTKAGAMVPICATIVIITAITAIAGQKIMDVLNSANPLIK